MSGAISLKVPAGAPPRDPNYQEAEMGYERLDEALRQLKTDREREGGVRKTSKKGGRRSQDAVRAN